ncbi:MAG: hypothetical protein J6D12_06445 [Peptostreptococcaceae bacterium]|nr:hypothetical protein [Peptostreptococcaceae bacterium]
MGLSANEKTKLNKEYEKSITLYRCVDSFVTMYKSKIDYMLIKNHKANIEGIQELIRALQDYKLYVEMNIPKSDLEQIEIFRVENKVLIKRLNVSDKKVISMKKEIRDKFVLVYEKYQELIKKFL